MRETRLSGSEGGARQSLAPTPIWGIVNLGMHRWGGCIPMLLATHPGALPRLPLRSASSRRRLPRRPVAADCTFALRRQQHRGGGAGLGRPSFILHFR